MTNITKIVREYISTHPHVKECLKKDIINFSSLARTIASELNIDEKKNFDAILVAARRCKDKIQGGISEDEIIRILKRSKVEIKNRISVVVMEKNVRLSNIIDLEKEAKRLSEVFRIIEGSNAITVITVDDLIPGLKKVSKNFIVRETSGLAEITIKSPKEIEVIPGIIAYLYSLFGENDINILETVSCWTDTIIIIKEEEISKVMELLKF